MVLVRVLKTNDKIDELDENPPEDEQKSEVLDAQYELNFRKPFASLLSTDRLRVFKSGTKDFRFTL